MNPATTAFLQQRFSDYYKKTVIVSPSALEQREWGFVLFNPGSADMRMRRHIGFSSREELTGYIQNLVPQHAYYSTAYYEKPDAGTMAEKGWCGADLIFDLDADHIVRGAYDVMLARVKVETEKLIAMLTVEFGMDPKTIELVFSGEEVPRPCQGSRVPELGKCRAAGADRLRLRYRSRSRNYALRKTDWFPRLAGTVPGFTYRIPTLGWIHVPRRCDGPSHRDGRHRERVSDELPEKPGSDYCVNRA